MSLDGELKDGGFHVRSSDDGHVTALYYHCPVHGPIMWSRWPSNQPQLGKQLQKEAHAEAFFQLDWDPCFLCD